MLLEVGKISERGFSLDFQMVVNQNLVEGKADSPFDIHLELKRKGERVKSRSRVQGSVKLICSRCADEFSYGIDSEFSVDILPVYYLREEKVSLQDKELDTVFYKNREIDIEKLIADQINILIPMKPLCKPDCKGVCPVCGANRNKVDCGHKIEALNPKLSQLKPILEVKNGSA